MVSIRREAWIVLLTAGANNLNSNSCPYRSREWDPSKHNKSANFTTVSFH